MDHIELKIEFLPSKINPEIIIAYLDELGFESFVEKEEEIYAYISSNLFSEEKVRKHRYFLSNKENLKFSYIPVKEKNWNKEWESNYSPVIIENTCIVRAPFHEKPKNIQYDIVIEPKMSFGTAHHPSTFLMIRALLEMQIKGRTILDMGCGTGVLAILAALKGAKDIIAIDNNDWAYENTLENIHKNQVDINAYMGDASTLKQFDRKDIFLANINRNVLLEDIPLYTNNIKNGGILVISGFLEDDLYLLDDKCLECGLTPAKRWEMEDWMAASYNYLTT